MAKVELPIVGTEVDTDDPAESAQNIVLGILGVAGTLGVVAGGQYLYNQARSATGAGESENPVPGV